MGESQTAHQQVQEYYGKTLQSSSDLQTSCCATSAIPAEHKAILGLLDDEVLAKSYGCGSPIPDVLDGLSILDLGCGTGRDCFVMAKLAGPEARVIGVDMTDEQINVGRRHLDATMERFGYATPNVDLRKGFIEDLAAIGIDDHSVDLVISNCVLNLSPEKRKVFGEIFRVLKPGGELYFADVYSDRRVPDALRDDPVFRGECLGGALYIEDFRRLVAALGCRDFRVMDRDPIALKNEQLATMAGNIRFTSLTIRAFNLSSLEDRQEDFGQIAVYKGTAPNKANAFVLDEQHRFETGRPVHVSGNTAAMLSETRLSSHFTVHGSRTVHYGRMPERKDRIERVATVTVEPNGHDGPSGCCP